MGAFKLEQFGGQLPAWDEHLLPAGQAASALNAYVFSGALTGWRVPKLLRTLQNSAAKSVFRIPAATSTDVTAAAAWLEFTDPYTDVMKSPVVADTFSRFYFASPSQQPQYNTLARIQASQPAFLLGIPAPGCAPGVAVTGGGSLATLGYSVQNSAGAPYYSGNSVFLVPITPPGAMDLQSITFTPQTTNATANVNAVLYSDQNGLPSQYLNQTGSSAGVTANNPTTLTFLNPTGLLRGVQYWIGIMFDTDMQLQQADNGKTGVTGRVTYSNGPPSFLAGLTASQPDLLIYATLQTSAVIEARGYVYTWVSAYGEEGPPSPPTLVNGWANGTWTVNTFTPTLPEMGTTRNITRTRIYRTVVSTGGLASYYFVAEQDVHLPSYVDAASDDTIALNNINNTALFYPPPADLQGLLSMPNGMAVGFRANELWFCEPYRPHAWPATYVLTTEFNIVGIGVTGNAVVAATLGSPYVAQGVSPKAMVLAKTTLFDPCVSRGSVLGTDDGVFYVSPNGLIAVTAATNKAQNVTETWITRERWRGLTPATGVKAIRLSSMYFAYQLGGTAGFAVEMAADASSFTIWPQPGGHRVGFGQMSAPLPYNVDNLLVDPWTGVGLMIANGGVYYYDFSDQAPTIQPYKWRSKIYQQKYKDNFEAMKIYFSVPPNTPAQNATRNTAPTNDPSWATLQPGQYGIVRVFADGVLVTAREIVASGELLRILSGFKAEEWQWEFEGRVQISNMQAATTAKELGSV